MSPCGRAPAHTCWCPFHCVICILLPGLSSCLLSTDTQRSSRPEATRPRPGCVAKRLGRGPGQRLRLCLSLILQSENNEAVSKDKNPGKPLRAKWLLVTQSSLYFHCLTDGIGYCGMEMNLLLIAVSVDACT